MPEFPPHREVPHEHRASEHLANERTFLAWVRTNIALTGLGLVVARLSDWLPSGDSRHSRSEARAGAIGLGLVGFGAVLTALAAWRYHVVNRQIEMGRVKTNRALVWFVAMAVILLSALIAFYLLRSR